MARVEAFYFENGPESGEAIFEAFASKHAALFEDNCDALQTENKLEYTAVYNEFCQVFEAHIESKTLIIDNLAEIIQQCGVSVEAFFNALKEMQEQNNDTDFYV